MSADSKLRFPPTFKNIYGAQMIAGMITTWLYGITLIMLIRYFVSHSRTDSAAIKATIAVLGTLSTLETIFVNHQIYDNFILKEGKLARSDPISFSVPGKTACIFLAGFVSQLFYASRIWRIGKSLENRFRFAVVPIIALAFLQLGGGLMQVVVMSEADSWNSMGKKVLTLVESMFIHGSAAAACDILITISLVAILRSSDTATRRTRNVVEKLVRYTVNRGILTSLFAFSSIFFYYFASGTYYYQIPLSSNTHIYVISVVSMLIAREGLRQNLDNSFHISNLAWKTDESGGDLDATQDTDTTKADHQTAVEGKC